MGALAQEGGVWERSEPWLRSAVAAAAAAACATANQHWPFLPAEGGAAAAVACIVCLLNLVLSCLGLPTLPCSGLPIPTLSYWHPILTY